MTENTFVMSEEEIYKAIENLNIKKAGFSFGLKQNYNIEISELGEVDERTMTMACVCTAMAQYTARRYTKQEYENAFMEVDIEKAAALLSNVFNAFNATNAEGKPKKAATKKVSR